MEVAEHSLRDMRAEYSPKFEVLCTGNKDMHTHCCFLFILSDGYNSFSPASGNSLSYVPFMFHVNASLSFCPSISISSLIGTRTSGWDAFSWITAGSWSSKLTESNNTVNATSTRHLAPTEGRQRLLEAIPKLQLPPQSLDS